QLLKNSKDLIFFHNEVILAADFNFCARVFAEKNFITCFNIKCFNSSVLKTITAAYGNNFTLSWLFFVSVWNDDSTNCFSFFLKSFDKNSVLKWFYCHRSSVSKFLQRKTLNFKIVTIVPSRRWVCQEKCQG